MEFQEKTSLTAVGVLFTAFEGEDAKPVSVHMRVRASSRASSRVMESVDRWLTSSQMSAANAKSFMNEVGMVQRELRGI